MKPATHRTALRVQSVLGPRFEVLEFEASTRSAAEAAAAIGCTVGQIAKSLVFRAAISDRPLIVITSGTNRVNESTLATHLGETIERAVADFFEALERGAATTASPRFDAWVALARSVNRPLWAYEAGTHDVKPKGDAVLTAQKDPRIGKSVELYVTNFFERGGDRLFWFVACARNTKEYTWGATWSPRATDAPRVERTQLVQLYRSRRSSAPPS